MRALLEGLLRLFIRVRRALNGETFYAGRERDWASDPRASALYGVGDVAGRLVNDAMVKGLQSNTNALSSPRKNNFIVMVLLNLVPLPGFGKREVEYSKENPSRNKFLHLN